MCYTIEENIIGAPKIQNKYCALQFYPTFFLI